MRILDSYGRDEVEHAALTMSVAKRSAATHGRQPGCRSRRMNETARSSQWEMRFSRLAPGASYGCCASRAFGSGSRPRGRKNSTSSRPRPTRNSRSAASCSAVSHGMTPMRKRVELEEEHDDERAEHRAEIVADAAGGEREENVDREQRHVDLRHDVARVMRIERAGEAGDRAADRERLHLERSTSLPAKAATCASSRIARSTRPNGEARTRSSTNTTSARTTRQNTR